MKDFIKTAIGAGVIVYIILAITAMLFWTPACAQWTPLHQVASEITESYTDITPRFTKVEPVRTPRPMPVVQPILPTNANTVQVFNLDQYGNVQSSQIIIDGSYNIPTRRQDQGRPARLR